MPAALRNLTGGQVMTPIGSNLDSAPMVVGKIQIDATVMLRDADVDRPPGPVKLSPGLKQIEGRADRSSARGCACGFVIFPASTRTEDGYCEPARSLGAHRS